MLVIPPLVNDVSFGKEFQDHAKLGYIIDPSPKSFTEKDVIYIEPNEKTSQIVLSEIRFQKSFSNKSIEFEDWVEVQNIHTEEVELSHYFLSDDQDDLYKWRLPKKRISPNEIYVIPLLKDKKRSKGSFRLSDSETLYLSHISQKLIERVNLKNFDPSIITKIDNTWFETDFATPSEENTLTHLKKLMISEVYPFKDEDTEWIELHNIGDNTINLQDYFIIIIGNKKQRLPDIRVEKNEYAVLSLSNNPLIDADIHLSMSAKKESIIILSKHFDVIDHIEYEGLKEGHSVGKNGQNALLYYDKPTKGLSTYRKSIWDISTNHN